MAKKDSDILVYQKAQNDIEKYTVWKETYKLQWLDNVVFDEDSTAYKIGIPPLRKCKLVEFKPEDKIVNRFEEILRHNNVSDKENAFNRLVALFICKLVDEITKQDSDEVDFQYKQGTDTYESLGKTANIIVDMLSTEAMISVHVAYGTIVNEIKEVSRSY